MMINPPLLPHLLNGVVTTVDAETARDEMAQQVYLYLNTEVMPTMLDMTNMIDPSAQHIWQTDALAEMWGQMGWFLSSPGGQRHHGRIREIASTVLETLA